MRAGGITSNDDGLLFKERHNLQPRVERVTDDLWSVCSPAHNWVAMGATAVQSQVEINIPNLRNPGR